MNDPQAMTYENKIKINIMHLASACSPYATLTMSVCPYLSICDKPEMKMLRTTYMYNSKLQLMEKR